MFSNNDNKENGRRTKLTRKAQKNSVRALLGIQRNRRHVRDHAELQQGSVLLEEMRVNR